MNNFVTLWAFLAKKGNKEFAYSIAVDSLSKFKRKPENYFTPIGLCARTLSLSFSCLLLLYSCSGKSDRVVGIKIYQYTGNADTLVRKWKDIGINTAFVSRDLAANNFFREVLRKNAIPTYVILPVFYNPPALSGDSSLYAITDEGKIAKDGWVEFVCPSRKDYRSRQISVLKEVVSDLKPDGISIDFIRQFIFWEKIYEDHPPETIHRACYCDHCLGDFSKKYGISLPDSLGSVTEKADHLLRYHDSKWNGYRTDLITSMVQEMYDEAKKTKPNIRICIHAVPWRHADFDDAGVRVAGQDLNFLSPFADYISPMCYSGMLRRQPGWISSVVADQNKRAADKILPSIQVYNVADSSKLDRENFADCLQEALRAPSQGVVFWSWPLFEKDPVRMEIAKTAIRSAD